ncbi:MAG: hypothetical protein QOI41_7330 [Myxococcales bacterium]|nr:hypothetical protein [Myxococcales bacterium]
MRSVTVYAFAAAALLYAVTGCNTPCKVLELDSASGSGNGSPPQTNAGNAAAPGKTPGTSTPADASRIVSEADVVQLDHDQNYVYAMSRGGALAVVDASQPATLRLLGTTTLSGQPFEMYRRGNVLLTMSNFGIDAQGAPVGGRPDLTPAPPVASSSALVAAVDVSDPAKIKTLRTLTVPGEIADSRVVGNVLYVATFQSSQCYGCAAEAHTVLTSFDIADPLAIRQIDQLSFTSPQQNVYPALTAAWKRSVVATATRLYVGGAAASLNGTDEGIIEVVDIADPTGHLAWGAKITTPGPITSRWQMDESAGVLRVISQRGVGRLPNGDGFPDIDTFRIDSTSSLVHLGHALLTLPQQESLKTVRFDGPRAYAITNNHVDPLFTVDFSDPIHPAQQGQLELPGWIYFLEPRGDRLIGLGLDRNDLGGNLQVSLFDVSNLVTPKLLDRTSFGPSNRYASTDEQIVGGVLAEDQDRIQKAFRIFDDGLMAIPFSGAMTSSGDSCISGGGVQLIEWTRTSLSKQALLSVAGNPRRAIRRDSGTSQELIAVSDSNVTSFSIEDRASGKLTADVTIGACVPRVIPQGGAGMPVGNDVSGGYPAGDDVGYWHGDVCH